MKPKIWYVFKGSSNFCSELILSDDCETMVKCKPEGFYDIVSEKDTVEGATPMVELSAYQALEAKLEILKSKQSQFESTLMETIRIRDLYILKDIRNFWRR